VVVIECLRFLHSAFILWQKVCLGLYLADKLCAGLEFGEGAVCEIEPGKRVCLMIL